MEQRQPFGEAIGARYILARHTVLAIVAVSRSRRTPGDFEEQTA